MEEYQRPEEPPKEPIREPAPLGSGQEFREMAGEFVVAAAKMVGRDLLHLLHIRRKPDYSASPQPWSDEQVRNWNRENGFPDDWRN
jgi:hypothetical protein